MDLLVIVPHPDDEVFGVGGTFIDFADSGLSTGLITLTKGEAGRTLGLCKPEELGAFRTTELQNSVDVLKIGTFELYDFPNDKPNVVQDGEPRGAGFEKHRGVKDHLEIVDLLIERIRALNPKRIVTFPPNGSNLHPDHVATHQMVFEAVRKSELEIKLYYFAAPKPYPGAEEGFRAPTHGRPISMGTFTHKLQAMAQHKTQALSVLGFMERYSERLANETFHLEGYTGPFNGTEF